MRRLHGGVASLVHDVTVRTADGIGHVVLRRVVPEPYNDAGGEVRREAAILQHLAGTGLAPTLLAIDPDGLRCGVPATLVTRFPGRPIVAPDLRTGRGRGSVDAWIGELAAALRSMQQCVPLDPMLFPSFIPWFRADAPAPTWSRRPSSWLRTRDALRAELPVGAPSPIVHRDFHPGNVLFRRGQVTGIVDWVHACRGAVEVDVSKCRVNLALLDDIDAADAFLAACGPLAAHYDRRWDALVALELAPWAHQLLAANKIGAHLVLDDIHRTLDELVIAAV